MNGEAIPARYSGMGEDFSPPLEWSGAPSNTKSFVIICEDPDAPKRAGMDHPFVHWVLFDIPSHVSFLPENLGREPELSRIEPARQGINSFGKVGYNGPMPPVGHGIHDYLFHLHALDRELGLPPGSTKEEVLQACAGHVLNSAKFVGFFERRAEEVGEEDRHAG
jgi:Raf kinase inhibitor-like YbhB/YbcL family protein